MKQYFKLNNLFGWLCFVAAFCIYSLTMQPTVSYWDCGEFIASAFGLQVVHQPGAPLFIMLGKLFSLAASNSEQIAFWVNLSSATASAATILFLFWTITALALKLVKLKDKELDKIQIATILSAGVVGSMAFAFSDTFWFSAVEAEVYALSALCTAVVFWAVLKWEARAEEPSANRYLVLIAYIMGLSIGIHLLNLLVIPAIVLVYYFRKTPDYTTHGIIKAILTGCVFVGFIQFGVIQYLILFAAKFDLFFVNIIGMGFGSGSVFFALIITTALSWGVFYSIKSKKVNLNLALVCITFILLGYTSYAMIVIRANAKTAINVSNPDNANSLHGYLVREQYEEQPLFYGQYFDSKYEGATETGKRYRKGIDKYEVAGVKMKRKFDRNIIFPRIYSDEAKHVSFYRQWLNIPETEQASFSKSLQFFTSYQLGFMYFRYFLWNFAGRQDDYQGIGDNRNGNWLTGIKAVDELHLGNQNELPVSIINNAGHNYFYALPLILGLIGISYQYRKNRKDALVILLLFFCTGIAIVIYLNQSPMQVRERDYAYVGSFYAFAISIGLGVLAVRELLTRISRPVISTALAAVVCFAAVPFIMGSEGWDDHDRSTNYTARQMAINYLQSCAPNAILFTQADNDTYPLWYVQQVEGVRKDIRLVNTELLNKDSYINQMKKQLFASKPLPITMDGSKYVEGVRDVLPYAEYGLADSIELMEIFEVLTSDNQADKVEMQDGSWENFLPTKKFKMSVDPEQVIRSGTLNPKSKINIVSKMEWVYPKNYVSKSDLAILDLLAHNNWKRPVYFSSTLSSDSYYGLDKYLHLEGLAFRLLPLDHSLSDERDKFDVTHTDVMFNNLMNKFELSSFRKATHLDPESQRVANLTWNAFNTLTTNLLHENKIANANKLMDKALSELPSRNYSVADTATRYRTAGNLYSLNEMVKANKQVKSATDFLGSELNYYASLNEADQKLARNDIGNVLSLLDAFKKLAVENQQMDLSKNILHIFNSARGKLVFSLEG
ncbi:MAG TPA: DUF2723 domain-containing protein [Sphingobacteriaceae bacterium]|nr:DUF2723 domain-containing protein [Sphingobacteriaceae bacterium]